MFLMKKQSIYIAFGFHFLCLKLTLSILKELSPTLDTRQKATSFY